MLACLYTSFIKDDRSRRRHLTEKLDDLVGHLNTTLARGGGNLNDPIFKSSNARALPKGFGGMLRFPVDRRIRVWIRKLLLLLFYLIIYFVIIIFFV